MLIPVNCCKNIFLSTLAGMLEHVFYTI